MNVQQVRACRICGNTQLVPLLDLGMMSLTSVFPAAGEPDPPAAPLVLAKCDERAPGSCGLVQLLHSVEQDAMYAGNDYGYRSGINATMRDHLAAVAAEASALVGLRPGDTVLDIGSNDGTLLGSYTVPGLRKVGIDPTSAQFAAHYEPTTLRIPRYFSAGVFHEALPGVRARLITSIAMFYDLPDPGAFVADIAEVLAGDGLWVFEQSYLPTMLAMNSYDTICHEHLEYYRLKQIFWLMERHGLRVVDVSFGPINGGSFRVAVTPADSPIPSRQEKVDQAVARELAGEYDRLETYAAFRERVERTRAELNARIDQDRQEGRAIYIYGASTKGNVILEYCGLDRTRIAAAAERNPRKYGRRTPGTNIPIVPEAEARADARSTFLVLPWSFADEFVRREADYLAAGGRLLIPLPDVRIVDGVHA